MLTFTICHYFFCIAQIYKSNGCMNFAVFSIYSHSVKNFRPKVTKVSQSIYGVSQRRYWLSKPFHFTGRIVDKYCSAFHAVHKLCSVKGKRAKVSIVQYGNTIYFSSKAMCRIINHFQVVRFGNAFNCFHVTWDSKNMRCQNSGSLFCNGRFNLNGIYIERLCIYIHKYRSATFPDYS